jgi:hypothetical protein
MIDQVFYVFIKVEVSHVETGFNRFSVWSYLINCQFVIFYFQWMNDELAQIKGARLQKYFAVIMELD